VTAASTTEHPTPPEVRHEPALARYTLWLDDRNVGLTDYSVSLREVTFTFTEVDPARRRQGLAAILIERALDDVRVRTALPVVAQCEYVAKWIDEHAEYHDLLTRGR
jgi:predicted GNAT family acetyltransferase